MDGMNQPQCKKARVERCFVDHTHDRYGQEMTQDHATSDKKLYAVVVRSCIDYVVEVRAPNADEAESIASYLEVPIEGDLVRNEGWPYDNSNDQGRSSRWEDLEMTITTVDAELISIDDHLHRKGMNGIIEQICGGGCDE